MDEDHIREIFAGLGEVTIRRMFGGRGIYHHGLIVALEVDGEVLLKADSVSAPNFEAAGARQWVYDGQKNRRPTAMPYWSIPERALDDADELALWTRRAYEAARRSAKLRIGSFGQSFRKLDRPGHLGRRDDRRRIAHVR